METNAHVIALHGIEMSYEVRGEGPPLLLLHGFFGCGADFAHVFDLDALARSFRLIVPDLRGHGRSTNPSGQFTHRQCARDVLALLDGLGIDAVRAIGTSLGGNVLLHVATLAPKRVEAMVLAGSPSFFPSQARTIMRSVTVETRSEAEWNEMRQKHVLGDDQIRSLWNTARGFADSYDDMAFTPPLLATIEARTMIVTGDRDVLYPVEIFVEQYRAIPGSSLWIMPNAGHHSIYMEQKEAFAAASVAFLRA